MRQDTSWKTSAAQRCAKQHNIPWKLFLDVILRPSFSLGLADAEGPQAVSASVLP